MKIGRRLAILLLACACLGQPNPDYDRVQQILETRCYACHGSKTQTHGLRLDRKTSALKGGNSGAPAVVPGNSAASLLYKYAAGLDPEIVMPPAGPRLTAGEIQTIKSWIDSGAVWPEDPALDKPQPRRGENHWSFRRRVDALVPAVKQRSWVRNPIDAFVLAKLEAQGWKPAPAAQPRQLLRRLYLDLIGLPPTLAEQEAFLKNPSPQAWDQVIHDLLERPAYAERWARHWLDLVRYAETNGYERDATKPEAWKYRDYVIRAFQHDKPFDRFILEQLAGDELPEVSPESLIATGYYRLGPWDDEPADPPTDRFDQLDDILSTTSQVFLGLTLGCARCHNHKFEPLTAQDYYSMVAIFNGLERPRKGRTELALPVGTRQQLAALAGRDGKIEPLNNQIAELRAQFQLKYLAAGRSALPPAVLAAFQTEPSKRSDEQKKLVNQNSKALDQELADALPEELRARIKRLEQEISELRVATPDLPLGYFLHEPKLPLSTHLLIRGKPTQPGPEVTPAVPAILVKSQPEFPNGEPTSQRRLTLARWLASPNNALATRVIVNRIWQHHFGDGLVRTPSDFGVMGEKPTHPELLDWLASRFVEQGWSFKRLHRLILTSNTYRMTKLWNQEYGQKDPENRLLWRFPYTRLEVEAIRDSMLAVSGRLNPKMFGPSVLPQIPAAALEGSSDPDKIWHPSEEDEASRRTIYVFLKRSMIVPMLDLLDLCDTARTAAKRLTTSVAPQALTLFNGDFVNRQARYFARRILLEVGPDPGKQIERAYRLALARPPHLSERQNMLEFLRAEAASLTAAEGLDAENSHLRALEEMSRVIFNLNEFAYTD